ncbi:DUF2497 domain-containing protein [Neogemmobacter tilapiae]|uniref:DUF2497 domain-containing protein n=1 Tax=Neogemmobacter tilapiae TaxID=875041 RepID=A0A918WH24_9RHOB|nr:DUF2497 domain-containing protein [Gemmobacter tilapiae]GHC46846.1 hypothetical protein GCM10007315_05790 [Gemmobacter tilapiae]
MSEQLGSVGGGDVLSSIRRLVSEEKLPKSRAIRIAALKPVEEPVSDKLLLTPALRVEEPVASVKPPKAKAAPKPRATKAKVEPVVTLVSVTPEPVVAEAPPAPDMPTAPDAPPAPIAAADPVDPMDAVIAALAQAMVEETVPEEAPATGVVVELSERRAEREETPKAEELVEELPDLTAEDEGPLLGMGADALRDLVREVLRAELQGEFGERITRNVRKLVRAEIARALMSRGIE